MFEQAGLKKSLSEKADFGLDCAGPGITLYYERMRPVLMVLLIAGALTFLQEEADAAIVYGHVYCNECPSPVALEFSNGTRIHTDANGDYRVYLEPGEYNVTIKLVNKTLEATIRSMSNPVRQDIYPHQVN